MTMSKNTYKVKTGKKKPRGGGDSVFSFIENKFNVNNFFRDGLPVKYLPYILFIMAIGIFYIGNNHYTEKTIRKITKMEKEVEDLRADYRTLQADYMHARLQSQVARRVKKLGLNESSTPPKKIIIKQGEY